MNTYYVVRSSRPAGLFSFGLSRDCPYASVGLTGEQLRRASVSNASRRHSYIIRAYVPTTFEPPGLTLT